MELRGFSALVIGASGFIGGRLAERLAAEEGVRVRGDKKMERWGDKKPDEEIRKWGDGER